MAKQLKDIGSIARKFATRAQSAGGEYKSGVEGTQADWAALTAAAKGSYEQGVTEAIGRGAFAKGVAAAGTAKWKDKASNIGASRYGQGVAGAEGAYATGFAKAHAVLNSLQYPPRGPRGSPQNLQRVAVVADALHRAKTG